MSDELHLAFSGRLKHGDLVAAMKARGWNQRQLGDYLGLSQTEVGKLINLQWVPRKANDDLQRKLLELTGKLPEDLWPEWSRTREFLDAEKTLDVFKAVTPELLQAAGVYALPPAPDEAFTHAEMAEAVRGVVATLSPRQRKVLELRFGLDGGPERTLDEIAEICDVSRTKIAEIQGKALAKLRHPSRVRRLRGHITL